MSKLTVDSASFVKPAVYTTQMSISSEKQFYRVVNWLNTNVGRGRLNWTMSGKVLKKLKATGHAVVVLYVYKGPFDESDIVAFAMTA